MKDGLAPMQAPPSTIIAYACAADSVSAAGVGKQRNRYYNMKGKATHDIHHYRSLIDKSQHRRNNYFGKLNHYVSSNTVKLQNMRRKSMMPAFSLVTNHIRHRRSKY
ncbi:unnamed protein product [Rotaria sp. Silwood1]|nr:unnamed protein product [Rotaria sp. Silwood1]CAF4953720.1 unnamed protein product [Rotaria sp. Silwood1]